MENQSETILVVEDDRKMNGKEALEKFYAHQPNLVLLDLMLPLVDGKEILKEIRSQYDTPIWNLALTTTSQNLSACPS